MQIPEYKRCSNGHLMYEDENYCVVCGFSRYNTVADYADKPFCRCKEEKFKFGEEFCPNCGRKLTE